MIRITSQREGFRRAGIAHPAAATDHPDDAFTAEQLAALQAEPMLTVEIIEDKAGSRARQPRKTTPD